MSATWSVGMKSADIIPINREARVQQLHEAYMRAVAAFNAQNNMATMARAVDAYKAWHREFTGVEFTY
jgi:hypothetical protein